MKMTESATRYNPYGLLHLIKALLQTPMHMLHATLWELPVTARLRAVVAHTVKDQATAGSMCFTWAHREAKETETHRNQACCEGLVA